MKLRIEEEIAAAAACGWRELHSYINSATERYDHPVPWPVHVEQCIMLINALRPTLEKYGARINLETHGESTFDVIKVIECTGTHLTGVCLDTANTFVNAEDPVLAAKRVAPYTHLTHTKDGIITLCDEGIIRQGRPPGQGCVDFEKILPILGEYCPDLPLSIEDHKWFFTARIYDEAWIAKNPELTPYELGQFVQTAWKTHKRIQSGELPPLDEYEGIPYLDQMDERLSFGKKYLRDLLLRHNLLS
jgi:sugar phosphate isomerase/epimerase